jgi:H+/Cl- antiporter ClcA
MRVRRASFIALFTAFVGCFLAFFVGDYLTRFAHMSNMEGGRGMFVVFVCAPLGILLGLLIGIISSILSDGKNWPDFSLHKVGRC